MKNVEQFYDSVNQIWKDNLTKDYHVDYIKLSRIQL